MSEQPDNADILERLFETIEDRRDAAAEDSYVASLFHKGSGAIAKKVGEEAVETVLAARAGERDAVVAESADLIFHWLILLADAGIAPAEVWDELARREGLSGLEEKRRRGDNR